MASRLVGHPGHLTPEQTEILGHFREVLLHDGTIHKLPDGSLSHDDATLTRFLRARNYDLQKSRKMLNQCEKWRKDIDIDTLAKTYPGDFPERPEVVKYWPEYWHKTDKQGRPVNIQHLGRLDIDRLYQVSNECRLTNYLAYGADRSHRLYIPVCVGIQGQPLEALSIIDLKGFKWSEFIKGRRFFQISTTLLQDYFPESIGSILVINAPYVFSKLWNWLKPWLAEATAAKVSVLSGDATEELLARISEENLPKVLGGSCSCEDTEGGCILSDAGPWKTPPIKSTEKSTTTYNTTERNGTIDGGGDGENNHDNRSKTDEEIVKELIARGRKIQNGAQLGPWSSSCTLPSASSPPSLPS